MNVLIPVQPGHDTGWISDYLSELRRNDPALMAYVLSVQPGYDGCVRMFFNKGQLFQFHCEDARAQSAALCESLAAGAVGIECSWRSAALPSGSRSSRGSGGVGIL